MARMNHQDRSLKIIARQNGWDPDEILGEVYNRPEDRIKVGDSSTIPASMRDPEASRANGSIEYVDITKLVHDEETSRRSIMLHQCPPFKLTTRRERTSD